MFDPEISQIITDLQVFTRDVRPRLVEMRDTVDRSILEQPLVPCAFGPTRVSMGSNGIYKDLMGI